MANRKAKDSSMMHRSTTKHDFESHLGELGDAPRLRLLSDEKLQRTHEASLEILEDVGVRVTTEEARTLLADAGCTLADEGIVRIPHQVVEDALASAPSCIVLYDREGNEALHLEGTNAYFGTGTTALYLRDVETGERRDARIEDIALVTRVSDALPNIDFVCTPLVARGTPEIPVEMASQKGFEAMLGNTTKPILVLTDDATMMTDCLDMAAAVAGGIEALRAKPFVVVLPSVVSPIFYDPATLGKVILAADRGIPVRCGSAPMAGGTAPVTLVGELVICIADFLGALVINQARSPGAPVLMGNTPAIMDMKTVNLSFSGPEASMLSIAIAEMAHFYGMPVYSSACLSSSTDADQQAVIEQMIGVYSAMLAGAHIVPHIGGLEAGTSFSLEAAVMGDEIIGMVRRIMRGMPVDDEALALDTIRAVGPGGNFLETEHTFRHYKNEQWQPTLLCRTTYDTWAEGGSKSMGDRAKEKLAGIIDSHQVKPLPGGVQTRITEIIEKRVQSLS